MAREAKRSRPSRRSLAAALLVLGACASGTWAWRRPDGTEDPRRLQEDVDACEEYARIADADGRFAWPSSPRPRGGWGSFSFERCMHERSWELRYVDPAAA